MTRSSGPRAARLLLAAVALASPASRAAQNAAQKPAQKPAQRTLLVRVRRTSNSGWVQGRLRSLRGDTLVTKRGDADDARPDTLALGCGAIVDTGVVYGHYTGTGAVIGYVATGLAFTIAHHDRNEDPTGAVVALLGGVVGGVYGSGMDRVRWHTTRFAHCD